MPMIAAYLGGQLQNYYPDYCRIAGRMIAASVWGSEGARPGDLVGAGSPYW
jgi:hypothetical protein